MLNSKKAFTLAEVLITLAIIGIVAALTIPALINQTQNREIVVAFKKDFSDLSNALTMIQKDNGSIAGSIGSNGPGFIAVLRNYVNFAKVCSSNSYSEGCADYTGISSANVKMLNGTNFWWPGLFAFSGAVLPNGSVIILNNFYPNCTLTGLIDVGVCTQITIDANGPKPPNIYGKDILDVYVTEVGLFPKGSRGDRASVTPVTYGCRDAGGNPNGEACAARILRDDAIDY